MYCRLIEYSAIIQIPEKTNSRLQWVGVRQSTRMKGLSLLLPLLAFANNLNRISGLGFTQDWIRGFTEIVSTTNQDDAHIQHVTIVIPGEEDEGAHPHDGVELADDKGFVAVSDTHY